jgi:HSP20 family protein
MAEEKKEIQVKQKQEIKESGGEPTKPGRQFVPPVDIYESEETVTVLAEMPGVNKSTVSIHLDNGVLTIRGCRKDEDIKKDTAVRLQEYENGHYLRRFTISEAIDQEKIEAIMKDGMLRLNLPKAEPAKPRRIEVKAA